MFLIKLICFVRNLGVYEVVVLCLLGSLQNIVVNIEMSFEWIVLVYEFILLIFINVFII